LNSGTSPLFHYLEELYYFFSKPYLDDSEFFSFQTLGQLKQLVGFVKGKGCRRFVENKEFGLHGERLGYLHHLLLGDAQIAYKDLRADVHIEVLQERSDLLVLSWPVQDGEVDSLPELPSEKYIFGYAHEVHKFELLIYRGNPEVLRVTGTVDLYLFPFEFDISFVFSASTGYDLDQR